MKKEDRVVYFIQVKICPSAVLILGDISEGECARLFGHLMRCEFDQLPEYMAWVSQNNNQFLVRHNQFLWRHCTLKNNICFNATYMQGMCQRSPLQVDRVADFTDKKKVQSNNFKHTLLDH